MAQLIGSAELDRLNTLARAKYPQAAEIRLEINMFGTALSLTESALGEDGRWKNTDFTDKVDFDPQLLDDDKVASYSKGTGSWFEARLSLRRDAEASLERFPQDRMDRISEGIGLPLSTESIQDELVIFPRYRENIPSWMVESLHVQGEAVPYLDPADDQVVVGEERIPYEEPSL